ncbi:FRAS1-related extracellular matrix protein 1b isoform X1 [Onychostoma macrolepis]|nr:FRAS1-related extracellular matrix protein 1b isoform X1 [Onychostoma macrolepis]XP_058617700.1 FRAS1-related extracellular matrix protein 1b isoform X1 [Onychostoma macrolepis]XP_058617702.1 FRAS1-related extracellular matrix protein 1b isoform X1 [Onychostoma macrolepis]
MGVDIFALTLFTLSHLWPHVQASSLVRLNTGLRVARGQSVFVTAGELQFHMDGVSEACKVEVVLTEPITQRVGKLTPQVFDCQFFPDEVKYVHNGSPLLDEDTAMLRVYRFTESETFVETVLLKIHVVEPQRSLTELGNVPLVVSEFYSLSNVINSSVLTFKTQPDVICTVRLLSSEISVPMLGQLVVEDPESMPASEPGPRRGRHTGITCPGNKACDHNTREVEFLKTDCAEFLTSGLKYQHLSPPSPEIDYIPIRVEFRDQTSRAMLETESIWIPVLIQGAMQNQPPNAAFMSTFILEVDQFILTPMTTAALDAKDDETPQARLIFNVTKPPAEGYITHLDDHTKTAFSFSWQDLNEMKIAYQPPNSSHTARRNYEVEFQAIDGSFVPSPPILMHISIRTAETNAPRVSWNMGLDLLEGQSRPITWEHLQVVDNDNIDAVTLIAMDGPLNGHLSVRGGKGFMFKVKDLREGVVVYHHSDSDTTRDYIVFRITDGRHSIRHKFPIYVLPKDDTPPFLINSVAFEVQEGGMVRVEEYMLMASDLDSSDDYIQYQLITFPRAGQLVKKSSPHEPGVPVKSFLQRDLFQGLIYYKHSGEEVFEDSFDFILSDVHQPPNLSDRHTVVIHVFPVKDQLPEEVSGTVRSITVKETEVVYITQNHLHFRDTEHLETDLLYVITHPCFSPGNTRLPDAGRLFYTDSTNSMKKDAMVPVLKSFTQHAVNHHKVAYMPPIEDIGPEPLFVLFVFSVSDQQGGALTGLTFNITVTPVDNQAPEMFTNLLRVEEGGGSFLMEEHLLVQDVDSSEDQLRVHMKTHPQHGRLELQGTALLEGDSFSLQDLKALRVRYIHDDSETLKDSIGLTITDGINSAHGTLLVQILPVNDEPPQLGSNLRAELSCKEGGQVQITVEYLSATDVDSEDTRLTYMLARTPARGVLQRNGVTVDKFSQLDVLNGLIFYLHTGGEIGPDPVSDTVTLIVSDGEAGTIDGCCQEDALPPPVPLHGTLPVYDLNITVMPVNNQVPTITLGTMFVVDEAASACLCGGVLEATDPDSHPDQLMFHLVTPPQYGFLENTLPSPGFEKSNAGLRVVTFSQRHVSSGFINYVQSVHQGVEPTADFFTISVSDGIQRSAPMPFYVIINPTNDEIPSLLLSNFTVMEGGMKDLSPDILNAVDVDIPADTLTMTILLPPAHGTLVNGIYGLEMNRYKNMNPDVLQRTLAIHSFTLQELQQGMKIMYMHDDTETLKDAFTIQLTDGGHTVQGTACVRIIPVNDEKPWLLKNAGIEVEAMGKRVISSVVLEAGDHDTPNDHLLYILNAGPRFGLLQLRTEAGWIDLSPGLNFTQEDVEMNRLWYNHTAVSGFKGHDRFHFVLSDGENTTPPQSFFISVRTVQKGDIALITKPVTLMEGERVILTTDILMATDSGSKPDELIYTVSVPPEHGHLHMVQSPGVPVLSFSQMDVAANRVCYTHDNSRFADRDSFSFAVTNGVTSRSGTINLTVEHSDRIPPTLTINKGLELTEGSMKTISTDDLKLTDPDTALENLTYVVIQSPQYGKLLLKGLPISKPRFTQLDIINMDLAYHHLNGRAKIDRFTFQPTDGTNTGYLEYGQLKREPAVFTIQIEVLDKTPPSIIHKGIPSTVENLPDGKQGIYITSKELRASDPDSPDDTLEFTITRPPHFGYLENVLTGAYIKGRFTQKDLEQKAVRFVIPADMEVTADSFEFQVTDPAGNTILPEVMEFRWSRVELSASCYRVCENAGTLAVQVVRSGNSKDPAYISIQVEEGTAKVGKDFTHSSANLIQFDPGVNVKMWNIYLKDDGLEENHEKFDVVLKTPKNAVLGQRNKATVEIVDPRNGRCHPDELIVEEDEKQHPVQSPPHVPEPEPPLLEEYTPDPRTGILWENYPPRGDVPYRTHFSHYSDGEHQDQEIFHSLGQRQLRILGRNRHRAHLSEVDNRNQERVWRFHGLIPVRVEEKSPAAPAPRVHSELEITPIWTWPGYSADAESVETPQRDSASFITASGVQQHKSQKSVSIGCPNGWTHYRRNCYILGPGFASWSSAQHACMLLESELVSIHSKTDMKWMWKFAGKQSFWIGLTGGPKQWSWTDGKLLTFSKLRKDNEEQASSAASCVLAQSQKIWIPKSCIDGSEHRYICSAPAQIS